MPKQLTPYIAPHSQTPAVSRANGRDGGSRTYARVPLYLRGKTLDINDTPKRPEVRNNSSIADSDKTILDNSAIFRGLKIHTFARFVQMVHAIVDVTTSMAGPIELSLTVLLLLSMECIN